MKEASDDELTPPPVQVHFSTIMAEEQPAPPALAFREAQEHQRDNLWLLYEHRLAEGKNTGERADDDALTDMVAAMIVEDPSFLDEQRVLYQSIRSACDIRCKRW